jgi:hypothetical protein
LSLRPGLPVCGEVLVPPRVALALKHRDAGVWFAGVDHGFHEPAPDNRRLLAQLGRHGVEPNGP